MRPRSAVDRASGTLTILRHWPGQRRAPFLDEEVLAARRDARVRAIVRHAAETVPHYRELFRREGIDPREIQGADDLGRLPTLDKQAVLADPERFRSDSPAARAAFRMRTSGTTGQPLDVYHDRGSLLANVAWSERDRAVEALVAGRGHRYHGVDVGSRSLTTLATQAFYRDASFRPFRPRRTYVPFDRGVDSVVARLRDLRPDVVRANGAYADAFFRTVHARGLDLPMPRALVYFGEAMSPDGRALVERLGSRVLSRYGAVEIFKLGYLCEERDGFHLYPDLSHVTVDDGEVVASNLVNRATVLLNYRLGDLARLTDEPCPCGRTGARLLDLEGRSFGVLFRADGEIVSPFVVWSTLRNVEGLIRFQLVQHERDRFELRLSTVDRESYDRAIGGVLDKLRPVLGGSSVEASFHAELEDEPGRKFRPMVLLPPPV